MSRFGIAWKTYLVMTLVVTSATLVCSYFFMAEKKNSLFLDKQNTLLSLVSGFEIALNEEKFSSDVRQMSLLAISDDEKAKMLNTLYQPMIDKLCEENPNYGFGLYAKEIERVVAIGPNFAPNMLKKVTRPESLRVYETKKPVIAEFHNSMGWNGKSILNVAYPVTKDGQMIGHMWASYRLEGLNAKIYQQYMIIAFVAFSFWLFSMYALYFIFKQLQHKLNILSQNIKCQNDEKKVFQEFPELIPVLETTIELRNNIQQAQERFEKAFNMNPHIMLIISVEYHTYVDVNEPFLQAIGLGREEVIGQPIDKINLWYSVEERIAVKKQLQDYGRLCNYEIKYLNRNTIHIGLLSVEKIVINNLQCYINIITDITEKKLLESEISRLDRLNIIGQVAAGIGHEVRNPMTTVRGYLQFFQRKPELHPYSGQITIMIEELDRANHIITEFLSLAKNKINEKKTGDLNSVIKAMFPLIQADAFCKGHSIVIEYQPIPLIMIDEKEIRQLILNMTRNALEAMQQSGIVTIKTYEADNKVIFEVSDTGTGIASEVLKKLGTPFFTTKDNGTGLGLAVCYRIVERHDAEIKIRTSPNGTTFEVYFNKIS